MKSAIAGLAAGLGLLVLPAAAEEAPPARTPAPVLPAPPQDHVG
jgi:hypothetical protein